jgi:hypothetical protein
MDWSLPAAAADWLNKRYDRPQLRKLAVNWEKVCR